MAKLTLIHIWEPTSEYDDYTDYAAYLYSKNNQIIGQLTTIDNLEFGDMAHVGYLGVPKFYLQDLKIHDLKQHINPIIVDIDAIREISCLRTPEIHVVTDLVQCKKIRNQLNTLQKTLATVHFEDYVQLNKAPIDELKKKMETECMTRFTGLLYRVTFSIGHYERTFMVMPDDVQTILGDDLFAQLSHNPSS